MYIAYILTQSTQQYLFMAKKISKLGTIVSIILGLFIFTYGIDLLLKFLPMLLSR